MSSFSQALNLTVGGAGLLGQVFSGGGTANLGYDPTVMQGLDSMQSRNISDSYLNANEQARLALSESLDEVERIAYQGRQFRDKQLIDYSANGILATEGSPVAVMNETSRLVNKEAQAQANRGAAVANAMRQNAGVQANSARAMLLGQRMSYATQQAQSIIRAAASQPDIAGSIVSLANGFATNSKSSVKAPQMQNPYGGMSSNSTSPLVSPAFPSGATSGGFYDPNFFRGSDLTWGA